MEKAGIDIVSKLITAPLTFPINAVNQYTFSADKDAKLAINPLYLL
jgi:hypothetical protein